MSFGGEEEMGADKSSCGENELGGELQDSFHTTLAFCHDHSSTNQLLWFGFATSPFM